MHEQMSQCPNGVATNRGPLRKQREFEQVANACGVRMEGGGQCVSVRDRWQIRSNEVP